MTDIDLAFASIEEVARLYRKRKVSPVEVTKLILARIEQLNPKINAYITVTADLALAQAKKAEAELYAPRGRKGHRDRGPLHGIPISLKDNIYTKGIRTTAGSKILENFIPQNDAVKSLGPESHPRRFQRRFRSRRSRRPLLWQHRHGHWRLDSHSRLLVRRCGSQTRHRPCLRGRCRPAFAPPRFRGSVSSYRRRCNASAGSHFRPRQTRPESVVGAKIAHAIFQETQTRDSEGVFLRCD